MTQKGNRLPPPRPNPWLAERIALLQKLLALTKANR